MKKNYIYNLLLTVFNLLVPIISFPYVARVLGPAGVGKVQFIMTLSQYVALLAALGIPIYGVREIAKARYHAETLSRTFSELISINFITSIVFCAIYLLLIFLHPFFAADLPLFCYSGLLILLSFTSIDWYFSGMEHFKIIALRSIIVKITALAMIIIFVRHPQDTLPYLFISMLAVLANNIFNVWTVRRQIRIRIQAAGLRRHMKPLFFIFGTTIASTLYTTFDSIILGFLSGDVAVGLYAAASKISKISTPIIMAYGAILIPEITKNYNAGKLQELRATLNRSYAYITLLAVPASVCLYVFAPALIALFSGDAFAAAVPAMRILSFLPLLIGYGYFWGYQVTLPFGKDPYLMYAAIAGMIVSLALNFALVPAMREHGAAIANTVSEIVVTLAYYLQVRKWLPVPLKHGYILQAFIACLPFAACLLLPSGWLLHSRLLTLTAELALGTVAYGGILLFLFRNDFLLELLAEQKKKLPFLNKLPG